MKIKIDPEVAAVIRYLCEGVIEDDGWSPQDAYTELVNGMLLKQIRVMAGKQKWNSMTESQQATYLKNGEN